MTEYPEKLIDRDPRNRLHLKQAFDIMLALGEITMTERAKKEIKEAGLIVHDKIMETEIMPEDAEAVVGGFYFHDLGLIFQDNIICLCTDCGDALQIRPELEANKSKALCCFCATDRILHDYHDTKTEDESQ